jgi:flagellar biosynthesis protein FlhA
VRPDMLLVMDAKGGKIDLPGDDTIEPTFGLPAKWIPDTSREEALFRNYTVVPPPTVITTHLTEVIKENIGELLTYGETQKLIDNVGDDHKKLVADTIPSQVSLAAMQRVLQRLLAEQVSIRDLPSILEAIAEACKVTSSIILITEHVRARLARQISYACADDNGQLNVVMLSNRWEQAFAESLTGSQDDKQLAMAPSVLQEFIRACREVYEKQAMLGVIPVLLTSSAIRPYVRAVVERFRSNTVVMSQNEVYSRIKLKSVGTV